MRLDSSSRHWRYNSQRADTIDHQYNRIFAPSSGIHALMSEVRKEQAMAGLTSALAKAAGYAGLGHIYEFVNADGRLTKWNCGQAAATTLLTHHGALRVCEDNPSSILCDIENVFPPDQLGGWFGSSRRRVTTICKAHGLCLKEIRGEEQLRAELTCGNPVVVMLGVSGGQLMGWDLPGGHWMVAYGFDDESIFLTNWGEPMPWPNFRKRWRSLVSQLIQMSDRGLAASGTTQRDVAKAPSSLD
jgi:hypothetical protein